MPYPNEHSCRLVDPETVKTVGSEDRKHNKKIYRVLFGIPKKNGKSIEQSYRYPKSDWSEDEARKHCKEKGGTFEAALKKAKDTIRVAIELADTDPLPMEIQILPFGKIHHDKGDFEVTEEMIDEIITSKYEDDIVIDYEHQTTKDVEAPAAGWIYELVKRTNGLWAKIKEWTPRAAEYIRNKEYRYISAVIDPQHKDHRTGEFKGWFLHSVGLTNVPWVKGMVPITMKHQLQNLEEKQMLEKLIKLLKLKDDAKEEDVIKAIEETIKKKDKPGPIASKEVLEVLGLKDDAKIEDIQGAVKALKDNAKEETDPDPEKYVLKGDFDKLNAEHKSTETELKKVTDALALKERNERVGKALTAGKITPAQREWAEGYALKDPAGFDAYIDKAMQIVPTEEIVMSEDGVPSGSAEEQLRALTDRKMLELKDRPWNECFSMVQKENPTLTNQYVREMGMSEKALQ